MVTDVFDGAWGGGMISTERFVAELRRKHDVTVISTGAQAPGKVVVPGYYFPVPAVKNIMQKTGFIFAIPRKKILEKEFADADIIHVQLPFLLGMGAVRLAGKMGKPAISSFHVQPENILYNIGVHSRLPVRMIHRFFIYMVYNRTRLVICPSEYGQRELAGAGLKVPTQVLSNGFLPQFTRVQAERNPEWKDYFVIYTVGRLAAEKRHDVIIDAICRSRYSSSIMLVVSGKGPREKQIRKYAEKLPVKARIAYVPEEELIRNYSTADLYVHASEVELESMSVLEAMACGLPPVISDAKASAAGQFALDERFLFKSGDASHLARRIDYWIENRNELRKASALYRKFSCDYRIEKSVARLESIYAGVIAETLEFSFSGVRAEST